jgi:hypothetical protein
MHVLSGWQGLAVLGIIAMAAWGLRFVLADFILDRFGRWVRRSDAMVGPAA